MINPEWRFWAPSGSIADGGPSQWYIHDLDQRRIIVVTMDDEQEEESVAIQHLRRHVDDLDPGVLEIHVSNEGDLISTSSSPDDDQTQAVNYPLLTHISKPESVKTIHRRHLRELDRLGPEVDKVADTQASLKNDNRSLVFKYSCVYESLFARWDEINISMRLPANPNIVPFDRIVIEELQGRHVVVGFTSHFIPGSTVFDNVSRVFKLSYLKQLTRVIDDLNLKYGISHQDVAPRNILLDEAHGNLVIFDFNFATRIGCGPRHRFVQYREDRNDVKGVIFTLYEIITRDGHFRKVDHAEQNPDDVLNMETWAQHPDVKLDHPVADYRSALGDWLRAREAGPKITIYTEAPEHLEWPDMGKPPQDYVVDLGDYPAGHPMLTPGWADQRSRAWKAGVDVVCWERPSQNSIKQGSYVLATGEVVEKPELASPS
ncbi:protein kinase-like domain protein [Diaporthe amygdali]|uniref:protein kinase-like domain protein n=1 Tax=Phomopsis amygdali TaxID=1214568 RepID=UPI0022FF03FF|nr:protein kinase-like domain protein [Diaporthe amygdali]KAJ0119689.1 protein kinase-like domain protein [Diaporthe amygdali]